MSIPGKTLTSDYSEKSDVLLFETTSLIFCSTTDPACELCTGESVWY